MTVTQLIDIAELINDEMRCRKELNAAKESAQRDADTIRRQVEIINRQVDQIEALRESREPATPTDESFENTMALIRQNLKGAEFIQIFDSTSYDAMDSASYNGYTEFIQDGPKRIKIVAEWPTPGRSRSPF